PIQMYGPAAASAVPDLIPFLKVRGEFETSSAVEALGEIGPAAREAVPLLIDSVVSEKVDFTEVARVIGCIGPNASNALPFLEQRLRSEEPAERLEAAAAITKIAPNRNINVVPVLEALEHVPRLEMADARSKNPAVITRPDPSSNYYKLAAQTALWRAGIQKEPPVREIAEEIERQSRPWEGIHCDDLIWLMGDIGPEASSGLP